MALTREGTVNGAPTAIKGRSIVFVRFLCGPFRRAFHCPLLVDHFGRGPWLFRKENPYLACCCCFFVVFFCCFFGSC